MDLKTAAALAVDEMFRAQVRVAALVQAHAVIAEGPKQHAIQSEKRYSFAAEVLDDGGLRRLDRCAWGLVSTPDFPDSPTEDDILAAMAAYWEDLALVTGGNKAF